MKKWWLELYTIPLLKVMGKAYVKVIIPAILVAMFLPDFLFLTYLMAFYIAHTMKKQSSMFMGANIEFHKLHVPLRELRKAFLFDSLIIFFAQMFCFISILGIAVFVRPEAMLDSFVMYGFILCMSSLMSFYSVAIQKKGAHATYQMIDKEKYRFISFVFSLGLGLGALVTAFVMLGLQFSFWAIATLIFGTIMCGYTLFIYRAVFHLEMTKGTPWVYFKYNMTGLACAAVLFLVTSIVLRPFVHMSGLSPELRAMAFSFSGKFTEELEVEEAHEILKADEVDEALVFKKTRGLEYAHVQSLIPKGHSSAYITYLRVVNNPTPNNLLFILETLSKKEKLNGFDRIAIQNVVRKWPKGHEMPPHLVAKFMKKSEVPKEERLPASETDQTQE